MKTINTIIIDDEPGALHTLRGMLGEFCPQISIVGEAMSVNDALKVVAQTEPELVFLDIEMSPYTGFDFLAMTRQFHFGVIFTTAYPQFAIDAINKIQPWSFLVKPYSINSLLEAVQIAIKKVEEAESAPIELAPTDNQGIILQDARKGNIVLKVRDIQYFKSTGATMEIFAFRNGKTEKYVQYSTLKDMEIQLPDNLFCRVHHSYIVNLSLIERYEITRHVRVIYLESGAEIPVSILKAPQFVAQMEAFLK